jgi:hypothetical protein
MKLKVTPIKKPKTQVIKVKRKHTEKPKSSTYTGYNLDPEVFRRSAVDIFNAPEPSRVCCGAITRNCYGVAYSDAIENSGIKAIKHKAFFCKLYNCDGWSRQKFDTNNGEYDVKDKGQEHRVWALLFAAEICREGL